MLSSNTPILSLWVMLLAQGTSRKYSIYIPRDLENVLILFPIPPPPPQLSPVNSSTNTDQVEDTHIYTSGDLKMALYSAPGPTATDRGQPAHSGTWHMTHPPVPPKPHLQISGLVVEPEIALEFCPSPSWLTVQSQSCPPQDGSGSSLPRKSVRAIPFCTSGHRPS